MQYNELEEKVIQWAYAKGIIDKATPLTQIEKTQEELDEAQELINLIKNNEIKAELAGVLDGGIIIIDEEELEQETDIVEDPEVEGTPETSSGTGTSTDSGPTSRPRPENNTGSSGSTGNNSSTGSSGGIGGNSNNDRNPGNGNGQGIGFGFRHGQNFSSNLQPLAKDELTFLKNKANYFMKKCLAPRPPSSLSEIATSLQADEDFFQNIICVVLILIF